MLLLYFVIWSFQRVAYNFHKKKLTCDIKVLQSLSTVIIYSHYLQSLSSHYLQSLSTVIIYSHYLQSLSSHYLQSLSTVIIQSLSTVIIYSHYLQSLSTVIIYSHYLQSLSTNTLLYPLLSPICRCTNKLPTFCCLSQLRASDASRR